MTIYSLEDIVMIWPKNPFAREKTQPSITEEQFREWKTNLNKDLSGFWKELKDEHNDTVIKQQETIPEEQYKTFFIQCMTYLWLFTFTFTLSISFISL